MTLHEALQRVYELAEAEMDHHTAQGFPENDEDREALDTFHDFVVNCPWLE